MPLADGEACRVNSLGCCWLVAPTKSVVVCVEEFAEVIFQSLLKHGLDIRRPLVSCCHFWNNKATCQKLMKSYVTGSSCSGVEANPSLRLLMPFQDFTIFGLNFAVDCAMHGSYSGAGGA